MKSEPLISVIVPVFKVEQYLDRCVESIVNQTYQNLQVILIDDGSPDNCPEKCDAWSEKDVRVNVIHQENGGLSDARNAGMRVARGEYIGFVDSDDWIAPEMYERLIEAMQKDESDIAACTVKMVWEDGSPENLLTVQKKCVLDRSEAQLALLKESLLKQPVWYKLYRSRIILEIPFEKGKYHEDVFWSYQAIGMARRVSIIDYIGYYYWQRSASIMGERYSLKRLDAVEAKVRRQDYLADSYPQLVSNGKIDIQWTCMYHGQMAVKYLDKNEKSDAFRYLEEVSKRYALIKSDISTVKLKHRIWLILEKTSFQFCCELRNKCRVGI